MGEATTPRVAETRVRAAFRKKVETLEGWVRDGGVPAGRDWPRGPVDLRRWSCAELGVVPWSSPNVASAEANADLRARFDAAVRTLGGLASAGRQARAEAKLAALLLQNQALVEQNVSLRLDIRKALDQVVNFHDLLAKALAREAELRKALATVHPLGLVEVR